MKLPKLPVNDEHKFYVIEGAMLQMFGDDSYDVYLDISMDNPFHSLAHSAVNDFTIYALNDTERHPETGFEITSVMRQLMCVRRCAFTPLFKGLKDCFTPHMMHLAIMEEGDEKPLRTLIQNTIGEIFVDLSNDDGFAKYLDASHATLELERMNLTRMLAHCELRSEKTNVPLIFDQPVHEKDVDAHLIEQFAFARTAINDFRSRVATGG